MAADQRKKKRVNVASLVGCTSHGKYRVNRKKLQVQRHDLSMRPFTSLEWDSRKRSVVSKKEQIGITRRHLIPFVEPGPCSHDILADVFPVPQEIFELENLSEVLSYEVWRNHLSDNERSFLSQFLPKELEPDKIVRDLLSGDNFHFGNPFMKWSASLCSGELHPDNIHHEEQSLKAVKKAYYSSLEKYHDGIIENLQMWKEKWSSCKDVEADALQKIWSSRKRGEGCTPSSEARFYGTDENFVGTPDSCSWANSEIAYSSENQNLDMVHGESQRRRDILKKRSDCTSGGVKPVAAASKKGERLHKLNIQHNDGAKYMSYIKVSREQHDRVKSSMKYAGSSIQPRSLNNVLGSFDALNVQPFARFEEEESKKLHDHWLKLATKDIPEGFANWRKRQLQLQEVIQSLGEEIKQKLELQETTRDSENVGSENNLMELSDDGDEEIPPSTTIEGVEKEESDGLLLEQKYNEEAVREMGTEKEDEKEIRSDYVFDEQADDDAGMIEDEDVPDHVFIQGHSEQQIASLNNSPRSTIITSPNPGFLQDQHQHQQRQISSLDSNPRTNSMEIESHGDSGSAKHEEPPIVSGYTGNINHVDIPLSRGHVLHSSSDVWPVGNVRGSYYQSNAPNAGYTPAQELSIGHPQFIQEQAVQMLDLEGRQDKDARKDLLHRQTDDMSFFSSYSNQDRSELLHSLFKGQSNLSYHQPQKHAGLEFQPANDAVMEAAQFPGHFREHVHPSVPLELRQKRMNDFYMHHNIQESVYSGGRFPMPRQEDLPVSIHDWATVNSVRMPAPSQPHMSSGELNLNWYTGENGNRGGWPSLEPVGVNHSLNSGSNSDQTLFSVLSECNELPRKASYDAMGSTERLIQAGNYSGIGGGIPSSSNFLQQSPNPLNYLSGHDASAGIKINNLGWMGMPQQNSGIQESIGKPFLRSWNQ